MISYPKNIIDCANEPNKGGLSKPELNKLATEMGINPKGLTKIAICKKIEKLVGKSKIPESTLGELQIDWSLFLDDLAEAGIDVD